MITIPLGETFCKKYNQENKTNYTPKEIFCKVLAPLAFENNKAYLIDMGNTPIGQRTKTSKDSLEVAVQKFCDKLENETDFHGLMTSTRVYGGCCEQSSTNCGTTYANINDNLYFDVNERYNSFNGMFFQLCVNGFNVCINNENLIWLLFESMKEYRNYLDYNLRSGDNEKFKKNKLLSWNTCYLYRKIINNEDCVNYDTFMNINGEIISSQCPNFLCVLISLMKMGIQIPYIQLHKIGQQNVTCPVIHVSIPAMTNLYNVYSTLLATDFNVTDISLFNKLFGDSIIHAVIQTGAITPHLIKQTILDNNDRNIIKYKQEIINCFMTTEDKTIAKEFGNLMLQCDKASGNITIKTQVNNVFASKKFYWLQKSIISLLEICKKQYTDTLPDFKNVFEYMSDIEPNEQDRFNNIMAYAELVYKQYV